MELKRPVKPRVVVCAANEWEGVIVPSVRHFDTLMHMLINALDERLKPYDPSGWEQGFIDQHGVFMTRTQAWEVAEAAGQIKYRCGGDDRNGGTLYSENLY